MNRRNSSCPLGDVTRRSSCARANEAQISAANVRHRFLRSRLGWGRSVDEQEAADKAFYAQLNPDFDKGSWRTRFPVAEKIAFATAGRTGGSAGSPKPVGEKVDFK